MYIYIYIYIYVHIVCMYICIYHLKQAWCITECSLPYFEFYFLLVVNEFCSLVEM